jgi:hypothetical protein
MLRNHIVYLRRWSGLLAIGTVVIGLMGCGGESTYHLSGTVSFNGSPIPDGYIIFEPDGSQGNTGQTGRSKITQGKYNTRSTDGMPIVGGPHLIRVVAHSAPMQADTVVGGEVVMPSLLFPPYSFTQDLPSANSTVDFEIPAEASKKRGKPAGVN